MSLLHVDFQYIAFKCRNFSMYDSGKIYVVIAVLAVVLLGFFIYLFNMDRKIKSLEQKIKSNE
jgi:ABC-type amino acid transport system permease subunit